jgi:UDPglucose 6-dehydrogenase
MRIGIIGCGVVGGALRDWLQIYTDHELKLYDPRLGFLDSLYGCDATFICVPVPTVSGKQDLTILEQSRAIATGVVFIRSTVLPGTNDKFETWSCPEFLTQRTAFEDTEKMPVLTGFPDLEFLQKIFPGKKILQMSNKECELAKYAHNSFGAIKVNFFNLIYGICAETGASYKNVLDGVLMSGYINPVHCDVPGHDGQFGFGGACFPKDLRAFNGMFPRITFESCLHENEIHRRGPKLATLPDLDNTMKDTAEASQLKST